MSLRFVLIRMPVPCSLHSVMFFQSKTFLHFTCLNDVLCLTAGHGHSSRVCFSLLDAFAKKRKNSRRQLTDMHQQRAPTGDSQTINTNSASYSVSFLYLFSKPSIYESPVVLIFALFLASLKEASFWKSSQCSPLPSPECIASLLQHTGLWLMGFQAFAAYYRPGWWQVSA